jgi:Tfp pilus assembly protein FimT
MNYKHKIRHTIDKIRKNGAAFTLIELLISLFIIMLMVAMFLANYSAGTRSNNLSLGTQQMAEDLRTAQNKALGSTQYNSSFPKGGWGVHFTTASTTKYAIFADTNGDKVYQANEMFQITPLPQSIVITGLSNGSAQTSLDITFLPPDPIVRIYNGTATSTTGYIYLKNTITGATAQVKVNILGLIQVN